MLGKVHGTNQVAALVLGRDLVNT